MNPYTFPCYPDPVAGKEGEEPLRLGKDEAWREFAVLVHDLARRLKPQSVALARVHALPPTTAEVLRIIVSRPGIGIHEIAEAALLQQSNVSSAVAELCRRGLVSKQPDLVDRRRVLVSPTAQAIEDGRRIEAAWGRLYTEAIAGLNAAHAQALHGAVPALHALDDRLATIDDEASQTPRA